jgi:hypothetical protein
LRRRRGWLPEDGGARGKCELEQLVVPSAGAALAVTPTTVAAQRSRIWRRHMDLGPLVEEREGRGGDGACRVGGAAVRVVH